MGKGLGEEEKEPGNGREGSGRRRGGAWEMKRKGRLKCIMPGIFLVLSSVLDST